MGSEMCIRDSLEFFVNNLQSSLEFLLYLRGNMVERCFHGRQSLLFSATGWIRPSQSVVYITLCWQQMLPSAKLAAHCLRKSVVLSDCSPMLTYDNVWSSMISDRAAQSAVISSGVWSEVTQTRMPAFPFATVGKKIAEP